MTGTPGECRILRDQGALAPERRPLMVSAASESAAAAVAREGIEEDQARQVSTWFLGWQGRTRPPPLEAQRSYRLGFERRQGETVWAAPPSLAQGV